MSDKYVIVEGSKGLILSNVPRRILSLLSKGDITYRDLHRSTKIPVNSLYVYGQRLKQKKLIRILKDRKTNEVRISLTKPISVVKATRI